MEIWLFAKKHLFNQLFFFISIGFMSFLVGVFIYVLQHEAVDFSVLEHISHAKPSILLDDQGKEFARFAQDKREWVTFDQLSSDLVKAFIAAEDHNFFSHSGISLKGIVRSFFVNLYHRRVVQGASTITQQLAKLMFLSYNRSLKRKIQEALLAFQLERHFTKEQILERYVNNVYFGRGIYGVAAAAQRFWGKTIDQISLHEAASLAAVAKSARYYSPLNALEKARRRRNIVLRSMFRLGFIDPDKYDAAKLNDLVIQDHLSGNGVRLYIQEWIRQWAENKWGRDALYTKGLNIQTTINSKQQAIAEKLFCKKVEELRKKVGENLNGGMISIEPNTGKIKVCIGGYNFRESQYNRAFQATRQVGSSFKPIVYATALQQGLRMDDVLVDEPLEMTFPGWSHVWKPRNWTRRFDGQMTLLKALATSNNIVTIKTALQAGIDNVVSVAKQFCFSKSLFPYPSIALGTVEASVEENVAAFNVFANNGWYVKPVLVDWVKDEWGKKLWECKTYTKKVLDSNVNSKMVHALALRLKQYKKAMGGKWIDAEVIGKTGSTNEAGTTWYVGATPELTTALYLGRDDNKPMGRYVFGYQTAYPVWLEFYRKLYFTKKHFYIDPNLREIPIDWNTGRLTRDVVTDDIVSILV